MTARKSQLVVSDRKDTSLIRQQAQTSLCIGLSLRRPTEQTTQETKEVLRLKESSQLRQGTTRIKPKLARSAFTVHSRHQLAVLCTPLAGAVARLMSRSKTSTFTSSSRVVSHLISMKLVYCSANVTLLRSIRSQHRQVACLTGKTSA